MKPGFAAAGLLRRLGAVGYDLLFLAALLFFAAIPVNLVDETLRAGGPVRWLVQAWFASVIAGYFLFFWRAGQTPGMRPWRLWLTDGSGGPASAGALLVRLAASLLAWLPAGLGFAWSLWDPQRRTWHDRLSGTRLEYRPLARPAPGPPERPADG
ncbi:MAG: RDD family protein [Gammaproteobacteria bacterium]|nr:RDD family protein [Gammaproteobacteria bacterium]